MFEYALAIMSLRYQNELLFVGDKIEKESIHHKACASGEHKMKLWLVAKYNFVTFIFYQDNWEL